MMDEYVITAMYATVFGVPSVALIRKDRPDWQAGLFNFIGGMVNEGEDIRSAAIRELKEEADLTVTILNHLETFKAQPAGVILHLFYGVCRNPVLLPQLTSERPRWVPLQFVDNYPLVPDIRSITKVLGDAYVQSQT